MNASFEEKSVWIQLVGLVVALGLYFVIAGLMLAAGVTHIMPYVPLFAVAVVVLVIVMTAGHALAALLRRPEPRDERDRLIEWRAESSAGWVLGVGVIGAICCLIISIAPVYVAHLLLLSLFISEVLKLSLQIVFYRRGM
jgi:hypothetical protein